MRTVKIVNKTRGTVIAEKASVADTAGTRRRGLLGSRELPNGEGLLILPCRQVHTFGMKYPIDLVFISRSFGVRHCVRGLRPWRLSPFIISSGAVLELPEGRIEESLTEIGDLLQLMEAKPD
jgi:hypothetical protein